MGCGSSNKTSNLKHKSDIAMSSALLIQQWYRRYRARLEIRRRSTWNIFQHIEYSGEQDQLKLYNFFNDMLKSVDESGTDKEGNSYRSLRGTRYAQQSFSDDEQELLRKTNPNLMVIESTYTGPHLVFPLNQISVKKLIQEFCEGKILHAKYVLKLLLDTRSHLKTLRTVYHASTAISRQITVCGDLHGNIEDLMLIFYKNGMPSSDNPYVFNGDFVDRGENSVGTALSLFACMLVNPNGVTLNRGNHEDHIMNLRYGFTKEIMQKYKAHTSKIVKLFEDVFSWLPLVTLIDNKIMVVHGGISDTTDLSIVENIKRERYLSVLRNPSGQHHSDMAFATTFEEDIDTQEWKQILDLLWSDPKPQLGCEPNSFRGGGSYFGPDTAKDFLTKHKLKMLVRSHECKQDGYEYTHNDLVLTIFSASNYYEIGSNKGAYVKFEGSELKPYCTPYMVSQANLPHTLAQRINVVEESAMKDLKEKFYAHRSELIVQFTQLDTNNTGRIKIDEWCKVVRSTLNLNLPWRTLRPKLVQSTVKDYVDYLTSFEDCTLTGFQNKSGPTVVEALYQNKNSLEVIFRMMDKDNSGLISMDEFTEACQVLTAHIKKPISGQYVKDLASSIDINKDGFIDFNEFLEAFRLVDKRPPSPTNKPPVNSSPNKPSATSSPNKPSVTKSSSKSPVTSLPNKTSVISSINNSPVTPPQKDNKNTSKKI